MLDEAWVFMRTDSDSVQLPACACPWQAAVGPSSACKQAVAATRLTATVQVKTEIMELVTFLRDPDRFLRMGARTPAGVLLCGAPGTGTALLQTHITLGAAWPVLTTHPHSTSSHRTAFGS